MKWARERERWGRGCDRGGELERGGGEETPRHGMGEREREVGERV